MAFHVNQQNNFDLWDYITGDDFCKSDQFDGIFAGGRFGLSISLNREYYFEQLEEMFPGIKTACRDPDNNYWTKWGKGIEILYNYRKDKFGHLSRFGVAVDVHRSILPNEIVIESDYETYEENFKASKIIGTILENKGFIPHYYYSGNKSLHIHIFLDWTILKATYWDINKQEVKKMRDLIIGDLERFKEDFTIWLRKKMISCWDSNIKEFDKDLINPSHLIRAELSKNKKGFKTFIGYSHKDVSFIPSICNEQNRIYPRLGEIRLSQPHCIQELIEEFYKNIYNKKKSQTIKRRTRPLVNWKPVPKGKLRECVKLILDDDFKNVKDGLKRGMFILINELKLTFGDDKAKQIINDWNNRMGNKIKQTEIDYRLKNKTYSLSCDKIHTFLKECGIKKEHECKRKVYK